MIRLGALACAVAGCTFLTFHPATSRPPGDLVPVELQRSRSWTVVLAANRDLQLRRIAWADANVAPCQGGIAPATIDRIAAVQFQDIRVASSRRLEIGFPKGPPEWPYATTPTAIDVEEVRPEGTVCRRIPLTGPSPEQQWRVPDDWSAFYGFEVGLSKDRTASSGAIDPVLFLDYTVGVGRWIGPLRLDVNGLFGTVTCRHCQELALIRAGAGAGVTAIVWQGRTRALEISGGYRLTSMFGSRTGSVTFNGARLAIAWGPTPVPIVGLQWNRARTVFAGFEAFGEWQTSGDSRVSPQLLLGLGLQLHTPF